LFVEYSLDTGCKQETETLKIVQPLEAYPNFCRIVVCFFASQNNVSQMIKKDTKILNFELVANKMA
jgi:hypothetical protein